MIINKWFNKLRRPKILNVSYDSVRGSTAVIFLHGIASNSDTWKPVLPIIPSIYRSITIDLLGFANSPKPTYLDYTVKDHARAVIRTINKLKVKTPYILVGHSMGGLIAVEIAKIEPKSVKQLILVSTPIYNSNDISKQTRIYNSNKKTVTNILFYIYDLLIEKQNLTLKAVQKILKVAPSGFPLMLDESSWYPFKMSLKKTIMQQKTMLDINKLQIPIVFLYGRLDALIIANNYNKLAKKNSKIKIIKTNSMHIISKNMSKKIIYSLKK